MSDHIITLLPSEEPIYQSYLSKTGKTDVQIMAGLKASLVTQVVQTINEAGHTKFDELPLTDKITFIG